MLLPLVWHDVDDDEIVSVARGDDLEGVSILVRAHPEKPGLAARCSDRPADRRCHHVAGTTRGNAVS